MKRILAMDTSGPSLSVALLCGGTLVYEGTQQSGRTHSERLMPLVEAALEAAGAEIGDVDLLAPVLGPGSFTGVRIGVATAKSLAHALDRPCVGVSALEALAAGVWGFAGTVCAMQDARAGQVYAAAFCQGERVMEDVAAPLEEVLAALKGRGVCCFAGDGAVAHRAQIEAATGGTAVFAPPEAMMVRAGTVARLAAGRLQEAVSWREIAPYYLRAPQAERERLARERAEGALDG